jgi:8-oxo-dGTP diphosphatase
MSDDRTYPERPIIGVGAVIVSGHRALVVRRANEPLKGQWSVPGGMLELGETLQQGLIREVLEETSLTVEPLEVLEVFDSIFRDPDGRVRYHYVLIDYLCNVVSGDATPATDVSDVRWVSEEELPALNMRDVTEAVVRKGIACFCAQKSHAPPL